MIKKIHEVQTVSAFRAEIRTSESFSHIALQFTGTNDTAQTLTLGNIGRIVVEKNGVQIVSANYDYLHSLNQIMGGTPRFDSATAGAVSTFLLIPRRFNDDNVETVTPADQYSISCTFNAAVDTAIAGNLTVRVGIVPERGVQKYDLGITQFTESVAASSTPVFEYSKPNIIMVLGSDLVSAVLTTASSNISTLAVNMDDFHSSHWPWTGWTGFTSAEFEIEAAFVLATVLWESTGDITSRLFDRVQVEVNNGSGGTATPEFLVLNQYYDLSRLDATIAAQTRRYNAILTNKQGVNRPREVEAIQKIAVSNKTVLRQTAL
jgi:hypothetical protein